MIKNKTRAAIFFLARIGTSLQPFEGGIKSV